MYPTGDSYKEAISARTVQYKWYGSIVFSNRTSLNFTSECIDQNKSKITRQCVTGENLEIGNVFTAELRLVLRDNDNWQISSRSYNYYDAEITVYFAVTHPIYGDYEIPCGIFTVTEAERTYHTVSLTAYDRGNRLNKKLQDKFTGDYSPFEAIWAVCHECDLRLAMSEQQIMALPNGTRNDLKMSIYKKGTSFKDILGNICTLLGSNAIIDRSGYLIIVKYGSTSARAISAGERYSSSYVDYVGRYTMLYAVNKKGEVDGYGYLEPSSSMRSLALNVGKNTLLNSYTSAEREDIIEEILDYFEDIVYSPCNVTMPTDPSIDVGDMVSLIGGEISGTYTLSIDTTVVEGKTYYSRSGSIYIPVTPVGSENPSAEGWYEVGASALCTKIEMPFYGQMKITSEAGSYELDIDPYATEKEQQEQQDNNDEQDKWEENEEKWGEQEEHNSETDDSLDNLTEEMGNLATKMAINYIFPYQTNTSPIADGGSAYVERFKFRCDREGDTLSYHSMLTFTASTTHANNTFHDCVLTVKYYLDNAVIAQSNHTYGDGSAILTLNGCIQPTSGEHTFDIEFSLSGGSIS